jgi:hypothetical protein
MDWESAKAIAEITSSGLALLGGFWALWVYHGNSRRDRARWADSLYKRFYERPELKAMRDLLDWQVYSSASAGTFSSPTEEKLRAGSTVTIVR